MRPLVLALAGGPAAALAHVAQADAAAPPAWSWDLAPWLLALLALSAFLYARGLRRLWTQAGRGRGVRVPQAWAFAAGWLCLVLALVSPLDALGGWLFSVHMVQHELLMVVAAPLLVAARPLATWTWALSPAQRRSVGGALQGRAWSRAWDALTAPLLAWALHALALWAWHVPAAFDAALAHEGWHILQHVSFLGTALLFWWSVLGHDPRGRYGPGHSIASLFTTMLHSGALGALLTLSSSPWYAPYLATTTALGFDPLADQQLGGLVMWVPAGLAYLAAALWVLSRMLSGARA